jgi:hypothetical protein
MRYTQIFRIKTLFPSPWSLSKNREKSKNLAKIPQKLTKNTLFDRGGGGGKKIFVY